MHILNFLVILHLLVSVQILAERRIFQGQEVATTEDVRSLVRVKTLLDKRGTRSSICGGTYIQAHWVISATHCIKSFLPLVNHRPKFRVLLCMGSVYRSKCPRRNDRVADGLFPYINGDPEYKTKDVLLIHIKRPWVLGASINFAKFMTTKITKNSLINKKCLVAGWGYKSLTELSEVLKVATVKIIGPNSLVCGEMSQTQICAAFLTGITCPGDSGGPLLCDNRLIGVVQSGTLFCNTTEKKSVFEFVQDYQDWITLVTQQKFMSSGSTIIAPNNLCLFLFCVTLRFLYILNR